MAVKYNNVQIWNTIWDNASLGYQERVPQATKANIQQNMENLFEYEAVRNEFAYALVNKIGMQMIRSGVWENRLGRFKKGTLPFGATVEEMQLGFARAHTYDPNRADQEKLLFGREALEQMSAYHKITREEFYKVSITDAELKRAFWNDYGLNDLVAKILQVPYTSDNFDEFNQMCGLFAEYDRAGGFFIQNVPTLSVEHSTDAEANAKYFLKVVRAYIETLTTPSRNYNAAKMPVWANPDELHLFLTPAASAALDVDALAGLFNIERGEIAARRTIINPEQMRIPDVQAILTTADFFQVYDTFYDTRQQDNAVSLDRNIFVHHHSIISASPFAPAILFSNARPTTTIPLNDTEPTSLEALVITDVNGEVVTELERGQYYQVAGSAVTTPEGGYNDAVSLSLSAHTSAWTRILNKGTLWVGPDEGATSLTITRVATDDNDVTDSTTVPVVGQRLIFLPREVVPDDDSDGLGEVTPAAPEFDDATDTITIPDSTGVEYQIAGAAVTGEVEITTATTVTAVALTGYEIATGATTSWTFTPTA